MLELKGVCKTYGPLTAVHPTDLSLPRGQTTVLLGPSGCGKSTLGRLVLRLLDRSRSLISLERLGFSADTYEMFEKKVKDRALQPKETAEREGILGGCGEGLSRPRGKANAKRNGSRSTIG